MPHTKAFFLLTLLLFLLWFNITFFFWMPLVSLAKHLEHDGQVILPGIIWMTVLTYAIGMLWLSSRMSYYMTIEKMPFLKGMKMGFRDARLYLSLLPVLGHWFVIPRRDKSDDDNDGP